MCDWSSALEFQSQAGTWLASGWHPGTEFHTRPHHWALLLACFEPK